MSSINKHIIVHALSILIGMFFITAPLGAQENPGAAPGAFLRLGYDARSMGMAGAVYATPNPNSASYFYNPALLPELSGKYLHVTSQFLPLDRTLYSLGFSIPIRPSGGLSVNWIHMGVGDIQGYNSYGEKTSSIDYGDDAFSISFAQKLGPNVRFGFSFRYLLQSIEGSNFQYSSNGKALDMGMLFLPHRRIRTAVIIRNIAGSMESSTDNLFEFGKTIKNNLPLYTIWALNYQPKFEFINLETTFIRSNMGEKDLLIGIEMGRKDIFLRTGIRDKLWYAGAGFVKKIGKKIDLSLDYSFNPGMVGEGYSHLFTWQFIM